MSQVLSRSRSGVLSLETAQELFVYEVLLNAVVSKSSIWLIMIVKISSLRQRGPVTVIVTFQ